MPAEYDDMVPREVAVDRVTSLRREFLADHPTERVPLDELDGRFLATDVIAESAHPARSHATMDGFALDATDPYPLTLSDDQIYPESDPPSLASGEAVRIATGAPLPDGANAVLKREDATVDDGELRGRDVDPGTYTYERGSNVREGETLFAAGERLSAKDALLLGDLGYESIAVAERFGVGLLATGTEIHEGRQSDLDSPMLAALVRSWGHEATYEGSVPDEYDRVRDWIAEVAGSHDVVVTTGGTSVGTKDHVIAALTELGDVRFHRVPVRPGKPIAVARLPDAGAVAIAILGKPDGAHTIATLVARPFFVGDEPLPTMTTSLARDVDVGPSGFEYVVPVSLAGGEAMPLGHADSALRVYDETFDPSVLSSSTRATRADGFVVTESGLTAGDDVTVVPYHAIE